MAFLKTDWPALVGKKFGKLEVIEFLGRGSDRQRYFVCRCECGVEKKIRGDTVIHEKIKSCGCSQAEFVSTTKDRHRTNRTPTYISWSSMTARCHRVGVPEYKKYGARGIVVCERWRGREGLQNFIEDMGERPAGKTIDRIDNEKGYFKENCRWATVSEQQRNRRDNQWIEFGGWRLLARDWEKVSGVSQHAIIRRIQKGWTIENALFTPGRKMRKAMAVR